MKSDKLKNILESDESIIYDTRVLWIKRFICRVFSYFLILSFILGVIIYGNLLINQCSIKNIVIFLFWILVLIFYIIRLFSITSDFVLLTNKNIIYKHMNKIKKISINNIIFFKPNSNIYIPVESMRLKTKDNNTLLFFNINAYKLAVELQKLIG